MMRKRLDFLTQYTKLAPLQLALIRSEEAFWLSQMEMVSPILDIGCGDGLFGQILFGGKRRAIKVGVDLDKDALEKAKKKPVYQKVLLADACCLPFKSGSFATAISNQCFEHIGQIEQALAEVARVLKKNGHLLFLVPTIWTDEYSLTSAPFKALGLNSFCQFFYQARNRLFRHYHLLPFVVWRKRLEKAGLKVLEYRYVGSKKRNFLSEIFWPLRAAQLLLEKMLKRKVLFPRQPGLWLARMSNSFLEKYERSKPVKGPTILIFAQKGS